MGVADSKEPDLQRAERVASENTVLRGLVGSTFTVCPTPAPATST